MDLKTIKLTLDELAEEKGIAPQKIIETIEMALAAAYKRDYGQRGQIIRANFNIETGAISFVQAKTVVDESMLKEEESEEEPIGEREETKPQKKGKDAESKESVPEPPTAETEEIKKVRFNPERHIMIDEAKKLKKDAAIGDELEFPLKVHKDYGRIAAQTAKQVIIQRIREAEREAIWTEFKEKEGEVISGTVQRIEGKNVFLDLGRATALLPYEEQVPHERYRIGERIVEIKGIAREPGSRSKIAAISHEDGVDPVGSLVGQRGVRVGTVISELGGEKIDIIEWSSDPARSLANALAPAKVLSVPDGK